MLQYNFHGRNTVVNSKVIRIDQEVWAELKRRAVPFEDSPNSVLRRILGLKADRVSGIIDSGAGEPDPRVAKLLRLVEAHVEEPLVSSPTRTGQSHRFKSQRGKVVAFIYTQHRRIKVESSESMSAEAAITTWDHWLKNGWWGQNNSVYWYIADDDDEAYKRVACVLASFWRR